MDKKKRAAIEKGAKKLAAAVTNGEVKVEPVAKVEKVAKAAKAVKEGAMPALPKLPSMRSGERKPRPTRPCSCGCGTLTKSQWAPGHDARAKGWAIRIERSICTMKDVPEAERAGAKLMLERRKTTGDTKSNITLAKSDRAVNE